MDGIDEGSLEFLVNALTELILNEDMAKKLKSGIQLPIMFDYTQQIGQVNFEDVSCIFTCQIFKNSQFIF